MVVSLHICTCSMLGVLVLTGRVLVFAGRFFVLVGGTAKQTDMFRILHATSHLGWVVRWWERFLFASIRTIASDVKL